MKQIIRLLFFSLVAVAFSGCGTLTKSSASAPSTLQLNLSMSDLEYLGESNIEASYRTYLGFIRVLDKVNGADYDRTNPKITLLSNSNTNKGFLNGVISKAAYKVLEDYPEAEYFQPVFKTKIKDRLFLGTNSTIKAVIKVYKYK